MREHARTVVDEGEAAFADSPAHRAILRENPARRRAQRVHDDRGRAVDRRGDHEQAVDRPSEVDRGRTRTADSLGQSGEQGVERRPRYGGRGRSRDHEPHRTSDADGGCTAHGERRDGVADVVDRAEVSLDIAVRQLPLVHDAHGESVVGPADGLDDVR